MAETVYSVAVERGVPKLSQATVLKKGSKEFIIEPSYAFGYKSRYSTVLDWDSMASPRAAWERYQTRATMEMNSCLARVQQLMGHLKVVEKELLALEE